MQLECLYDELYGVESIDHPSATMQAFLGMAKSTIRMA